MNFERWVWTELVAFDHEAPDCGVEAYLATLGFVPSVVCLLVSAPDFVLQHSSMTCEFELPPDVCSRDAHPGNETRARQRWTNFQLRKLIAGLRAAGADTYCSIFTTFHLNRFHHEWMSDHPEARQVWSSDHRGLNLNPLGMLNDGTLVEDIFIPRLAQVCRDYGFAGWHGPDGWGPLSSGNIMNTDFSDGIMKQFLALHRDWVLPECLCKSCPEIVTQEERTAARDAGLPLPETGLAQLRERGRWIWEEHRLEWIEFNVDRWCGFWRKAATALHGIGCRLAVNSAWTKGCFDARYDFGVDYRKMFAQHIDAMVVETVALGMGVTNPGEGDWYHDDYASALADIKAAWPEAKLIFLHGIKDVVERWDNLRHSTPGYERELYKLSDLYYRDGNGLQRCAAGLLACLADGIAGHEWKFIRERWLASFDGEPVDAGEVTLLWSDASLDAGIPDFMRDGFLPAQKQAAALMREGVQLQTVCRIENHACCTGALFVPGAHLIADSLLDEILTAHSSPVILCGRAAALKRFQPVAATVSDGRMMIAIVEPAHPGEHTVLPTPDAPYVPSTGDLYFSKDRARQAVEPGFWKVAAVAVNEATARDCAARGVAFARVDGRDCTLLVRRLDADTLDVALENRTVWERISRTVHLNRPLESLQILSSFPLRESRRPDAGSFTVPVPPRGISVIRIHLKKNTIQPKEM